MHSVTYLAKDASLTADPGVVSSIPVPYFRGDWSWNNITVILLPSARLVVSYKRTYVHEVLVNCLGKRVVRWPEHPAMTIAVDLGRKATKTKQAVWKSVCILIPWYNRSRHGVVNKSLAMYSEVPISFQAPPVCPKRVCPKRLSHVPRLYMTLCWWDVKHKLTQITLTLVSPVE